MTGLGPDCPEANPYDPPAPGPSRPPLPRRSLLAWAVPMPVVGAVLGIGVAILSSIGRPGCVQDPLGDLIGQVIVVGGAAWGVRRVGRWLSRP